MRQTIRTAILFLLVTLGLSSDIYAQGIEECQPDDKVIVFFGNGMETAWYKADFSRRKLQDLLEQEMDLNHPTIQKDSICYLIAHNSNELGWTDMLQAYVQLVSSDTARFWRLISRIELLPNLLQIRFQQIAQLLDSISYVNDPDLQLQVDRYRKEISLNDRKVIVVAHSQGNFYANRAYSLLFQSGSPLPTEKFEIISVANPDNHVEGNVNYTTLFGDFILAVPGRLNPNTPISGTNCNSNGQLPGDNAFECHGFVESYLKGIISKPQILSQIISAIPTSTSPPIGLHQLTNTQPGNFPGSPIGINQDGSRIALYGGNVNSPEGGQIWSINSDGSNYARITSTTLNVVQARFRGNKGIFVACNSPCSWSNPGTPGDIYTVNYDGSGLARLTQDGSSANNILYTAVDISDDGTKALFRKNIGVPFGTPEIRWYLSKSDGTTTELFLPIYLVDLPSISNDGSKLGLAYRDSGSGNNRLGVLDTTTMAVLNLLDVQSSFGMDIELTGDGQNLVFAGPVSFSQSNLATIQADGSSLPQILDSSLTYGFSHISISYNGSTVCYIRSNSTQNIFCFDTGSSSPTNITNILNSSSIVDLPFISSDGRVVVFISNADLDSNKNTDSSQEIFVAVLR